MIHDIMRWQEYIWKTKRKINHTTGEQLTYLKIVTMKKEVN